MKDSKAIHKVRFIMRVSKERGGGGGGGGPLVGGGLNFWLFEGGRFIFWKKGKKN